MATVVWSNWQRWSVHLSPSEGSPAHSGSTTVLHASLMPFYDDNFANSENYYIWSVHLSPSEGTLWISRKDTSGNIFHQPVRLVLPSHLLLSYFCYFIKSLLFYLVVPPHLFVISYHILCSRSYLSSAHIFPWVSVMMGQSCIPAVATVFRTEMVHYREVCVFGPTLSFQSNLFNSLGWYIYYLNRDTNISTGSLTIVILRRNFQCEIVLWVDVMRLAQETMNDDLMIIWTYNDFDFGKFAHPCDVTGWLAKKMHMPEWE